MLDRIEERGRSAKPQARRHLGSISIRPAPFFDRAWPVAVVAISLIATIVWASLLVYGLLRWTNVLG